MGRVISLYLPDELWDRLERYFRLVKRQSIAPKTVRRASVAKALLENGLERAERRLKSKRG